jgi:hypothetical protein
VNNDKNYLIISRSFNCLIDTYVNKTIYSVSTDSVLSQLGDKEFIDLKHQQLICIFPNSIYKNLTNVDYFITDGSIDFKEDTVEQIQIQDIKDFFIYKNSDTSRIYPVHVPIFPYKKGDTQIIEAYRAIFLTQHTLDKYWTYISSNKHGALIYGPYCEITAGVYDFIFHYEYSGKLDDGQQIGTADVYLGDIDKVLATAELYAGESKVILKGVNVLLDCKKTETRIFTNKEKLKFLRLEVTKTK